MNKNCLFLVLIFIISLTECSRARQGSKQMHPSALAKGLEKNAELPNFRMTVTPIPVSRIDDETVWALSPSYFQINFNANNEIVEEAIFRTYNNIFLYPRFEGKHEGLTLICLNIHIQDLESRLKTGVAENYELYINKSSADLYASTIWGALKGLETFSQLIYYWKENNKYYVKSVVIRDWPDYVFRGFLMDTARHYLPTNLIYKHIDAMSAAKLNVLHWHMVDIQSFPYASVRKPELHKKGAYNPQTHVYTMSDVKKIVNFAYKRGIQVVIELDTPGHIDSWVGARDILISCERNVSDEWLGLYLLDPSKDSTYEYIYELYSEMKQFYKGDIFHIGGDEVEGECWFKNPDVHKYAEDRNITSPRELQHHYTERLLSRLDQLYDSYIGWEEVYLGLRNLKKNFIVHFWTPNNHYYVSYALNDGLRVLISHPFYINYYGEDPSYWQQPYQFDLRKGIDPSKTHLILGSTICMWGEFASSANMLEDSWVTAAVIAERLWSPFIENYDKDMAIERFNNFYCTLRRRNIPSKRLTPSFECL